MTTPADHMTIAEIIHDFATRQGDLTDRWAREDLAAILEQRMVAERAGVLREAADDLGALNDIGMTRRDLISDEDWLWFTKHSFREHALHNTGDAARAASGWLRERADRAAS